MGVSSLVIQAYPTTTQVTVLSHGATWDYVQIGSQTGYMMTKYLSKNEPAPAPAPAPVEAPIIEAKIHCPVEGCDQFLDENHNCSVHGHFDL